jgi:uncharacterized phage-associated protein
MGPGISPRARSVPAQPIAKGVKLHHRSFLQNFCRLQGFFSWGKLPLPGRLKPAMCSPMEENLCINIFDVARYIIGAIGCDEISTVLLQKLCYYSQAWHLVFTEKPLFAEDFLRWEYGPVCRELWDIHKGLMTIKNGHIPEEICLRGQFSSSNCGAIDHALVRYGSMAPFAISKLTHEEDPWLLTKKDCVIPKKMIMDYYFSKSDDEGPVCEGIERSHEELLKRISEAPDQGIYSSAEEMFQAILG